MSKSKPCSICGEVPYPPTPDGICNECRTANYDERQQRASMREANLQVHAQHKAKDQELEREKLERYRDARGKGPCIRCGCAKLIRYKAHERGSEGSDHTSEVWKPMCVAEHTVSHGLITHSKIPFGPFLAYICLGCGYVDWYVANPNWIPIDDKLNTELIECDTEGPYR